jgi:2-C-methyl-D-erythritol 4-phosphate cytidylyltransferase
MNTAIVVAAGKGERLFQKLGMKKQFYPLYKNKEMFLLSLEPFLLDKSFSHIVLVIPQEDEKKVCGILKREKIDDKVQLAFGGAERETSVLNALNALLVSCPELKESETKVFIHDADRPLLTQALLKRLEKAAEKNEAVVPAVKLKDSLFCTAEDKYVNRADYLAVQTPQVFSLQAISDAFAFVAGEEKVYKDEGSICKFAGLKVAFIEGEEENLKVTDEISLKMALLYFEEREKSHE